MKKSFLNAIYIFTIVLSTFSIKEAFAERGPSIEPFVEVDIENTNADSSKTNGFNFQNEHKAKFNSLRKPAGIVSKDGATSPYSYLGPILFLLALPFAIWMVISRKVSDIKTEDKTDYYGKTFQFTPFKTDYQKSDDDDDIDYPKAS